MDKAEPHTMLRREFLALGPALAVPAMLLASGSRVLAAGARPLPGLVGPVSVGYWRGSETLPSLDWETAKEGLDPAMGPDVIPADALPEGDAMFPATGVRLTIHGLFPESARASLAGRANVMLDVVYDRAPRTVFRAWTLRGGPQASLSSRLSVLVPVDDARGLDLAGQLTGPGQLQSAAPISGRLAQKALRGKPAPKPAPQPIDSKAFSARLSPGVEPYTPKLRRGFYLLGLPGRLGGEPPSWMDYTDEIARPEFSCLLLSVEYGDVAR